MAIGEYAEAAGQYKQAYSRTSPKEKELRGRIAFKMGDAYARYGYTARAVGALRNAERYKYTDTLTLRLLGEQLQKQGDYKGAEKALTAYLERFPDDAAAHTALQNCHTQETLRRQSSAYTVKPATQFNANRSDYCPAYMGTEAAQLYFTSTRKQSLGDVSGITAMQNGDIFFAKKKENGNPLKHPREI